MIKKSALKKTWLPEEFSRKLKVESAEMGIPIVKYARLLNNIDLKSMAKTEMQKLKNENKTKKRFVW